MPKSLHRCLHFILPIAALACFVQSVMSQVIKESFPKLLWIENFDSAGTYWRNVNNANESMIFGRGRYLIERKNTAAGLHIFPQGLPEVADFEAEFTFQMGEKENSSGGLLLMGQSDAKGAFLIELNRNGNYRIMQFNGVQYNPIGKEGLRQGWKAHKSIQPRGLNTVVVKCYSRKYDLLINGNFIESFFEPRWVKGNIGIYIGPASQMQADRMVLRVPLNAKLSDSLPPKEKVLTDIIISLRQTINEQNNELDSLKRELKSLSGGKAGTDDPVKLRAEIKALQKENAQLKRQVSDLEKFKKSVEKGGDADVIIKLTQLLDDEQKEKNRLIVENENLRQEIERLKELLE